MGGLLNTVVRDPSSRPTRQGRSAKEGRVHGLLGCVSYRSMGRAACRASMARTPGGGVDVVVFARGHSQHVGQAAKGVACLALRVGEPRGRVAVESPAIRGYCEQRTALRLAMCSLNINHLRPADGVGLVTQAAAYQTPASVIEPASPCSRRLPRSRHRSLRGRVPLGACRYTIATAEGALTRQHTPDADVSS